MSVIKKYNRYCEQLEELNDPAYSIPLPTPLSTKLADLRNDQTLLQDVWISPSTGEIPRWLEDPDVRDGIRALLKRKCCHEEQRRLGLEADNMCRWFSLELFALKFALRQPENSLLYTSLQQRREEQLELEEHWPTPLASSKRYAAERERAVRLVNLLSGSASAANDLLWLSPITCSLPPLDDSEINDGPEEVDLVTEVVPQGEHVLLDDVLNGGDYEDEEDGHEAVLTAKLQWNLSPS